jgi:hypothetical protein
MEIPSGFMQELEKIDKIKIEKFHNFKDGWQKHFDTAINLSYPGVLLACNEYKELIKMGKEILPLIFIEYNKSYDLPWCTLLTAITGVDFGNEYNDDQKNIQKKWFDWANKKFS